MAYPLELLNGARPAQIRHRTTCSLGYRITTILKQMNTVYPDQLEIAGFLVSSAESQRNLIFSLIGLPSLDGGGDPATAEPAAIEIA